MRDREMVAVVVVIAMIAILSINRAWYGFGDLIPGTRAQRLERTAKLGRASGGDRQVRAAADRRRARPGSPTGREAPTPPWLDNASPSQGTKQKAPAPRNPDSARLEQRAAPTETVDRLVTGQLDAWWCSFRVDRRSHSRGVAPARRDQERSQSLN